VRQSLVASMRPVLWSPEPMVKAHDMCVRHLPALNCEATGTVENLYVTVTLYKFASVLVYFHYKVTEPILCE
jgi:hypothetical protein